MSCTPTAADRSMHRVQLHSSGYERVSVGVRPGSGRRMWVMVIWGASDRGGNVRWRRGAVGGFSVSISRDDE